MLSSITILVDQRNGRHKGVMDGNCYYKLLIFEESARNENIRYIVGSRGASQLGGIF